MALECHSGTNKRKENYEKCNNKICPGGVIRPGRGGGGHDAKKMKKRMQGRGDGGRCSQRNRRKQQNIMEKNNATNKVKENIKMKKKTGLGRGELVKNEKNVNNEKFKSNLLCFRAVDF